MADRGRPLSLCALVPYPRDTAPSQRFRIEQWTPHLEAEGIRVDLVPFADPALMELLYSPRRTAAKALATVSAFGRRLGALASARRHDVFVVHRAASLAGPALVERALTLLGRPWIYDFDDALYLLHASDANRRTAWLKFPGKTARLCALSDHVVAANATLAAYARQYNPQVTVIPSSVDTDRFRPPRKGGADRPLVIGWTGSFTSQAYLESFAPVLEDLLGRRRVELRVHSDREPLLPGLSFVWRPWAPENEPEEIGRFDIGIMPMPDEPWARGKSAMKALLYMAMGIPTVCSPVGTNQELIRHGDNGLLAATPDDWRRCLESLIDDPLLRDRLGRAGRRTVEEGYSAPRSAGLFASVVRGTAER